MNDIDSKRKALDIKRLEFSVMESELKIDERLADIARIENNINDQKIKIEELKKELNK